MRGLYDIHCHILPGVDDGARNMEEACWMLKKEYEEGVRRIIVTPHFRYEMFEPPLKLVKEQFARVKQAAAEIGLSLIHIYTLHPRKNPSTQGINSIIC